MILYICTIEGLKGPVKIYLTINDLKIVYGPKKAEIFLWKRSLWITVTPKDSINSYPDDHFISILWYWNGRWRPTQWDLVLTLLLLISVSRVWKDSWSPKPNKAINCSTYNNIGRKFRTWIRTERKIPTYERFDIKNNYLRVLL